ncbi:hypothetical protein AB0C27_10635 [Nonomuraea sp. NPDC048882]|uniref:hypothetical protein n=1 Tax=Nonomuraea sp. NPDC048882 TaxID=3154347 RepID=UPI0033CF7AAF
MKFVSRILLGFTAAAVVAIGAPVAANASVTSATPAASSYDGWGPYFSADHKAKAYGHVSVDRKRFKHWYWKTDVVKKRECRKDHKGHRHCRWVEKTFKKKVWEWRFDHFYTVHSTLQNYKWWGRNKCAWETFKVVNHDGSSYFRTFSQCGKHRGHFSFHGKNAAHIYVNVSRGGHHRPTGHYSGWKDVYHAAV